MKRTLDQTWGAQGGTGAPGPTSSGPATIPFTYVRA